MSDPTVPTADDPWADLRDDVEADRVEMYREMLPDYSDEEIRNFLAKEEWLSEVASDEEKLRTHPAVVEVDADTVTDDGLYVVTQYADMPSDIGLSGDDLLSDMLGWHDLLFRIKSYTSYERTNHRLVDGQLVITLAPKMRV